MRPWLLLFVVVASSACSSYFRVTPIINVEGRQGTSLRLAFGPGVPSSARVKCPRTTLNRYGHWQDLLRDGFEEGFSRGFKVTEDDHADLTLAIMTTELAYVDAPNDQAVATLRYEARLFDASGHTSATTTGTTHGDPGPRRRMIPSTFGAVERMYETIAEDFFKRPRA